MPSRRKEIARSYAKANPRRSDESHIAYRHRRDRHVENRAGFTDKRKAANSYSPKTDEEWEQHHQELVDIIQRRKEDERASEEGRKAAEKAREQRMVKGLTEFLDSFENGDSITERAFSNAVSDIVSFKNNIMQSEQLREWPYQRMSDSQKRIRGFVERNRLLITRLENFQKAMKKEKVRTNIFGIRASFPKTVKGYEKSLNSLPNTVDAINRATTKIAAAKTSATRALGDRSFSDPMIEPNAASRAGLGRRSGAKGEAVARKLSVG